MAICAGIPESTASPILDLALGSLQSVLSAESTNMFLPASVTFSLLRASPSFPLNGETSWLKNESMVPIGASSNRVRSCSINP